MHRTRRPSVPLSFLPLLTLVLIFARTAHADVGNVQTIQTAAVEVRSGPSLNYYATSKLALGDKVTVVREQDKDWLAIEPPAPGQDSFSWVNAQAVRVSARSAVVVVAETPVRVGSRLLDQPPTVEQVKVLQGTQLTVIGSAQSSPDGTWWPILPPPKEVRYIPATAVKSNSTVQATAPALPVKGDPVLGRPAASSTPASSDPLLVKAEQAVRGGNFGEAIRLYDQLAQETSDPNLKIDCRNRSQFLRDSTGASQALLARSAAGDNRPIATSGAPSVPVSYFPVAQRTAPTPYYYVSDPCYTVRLRPPVLSNPPPMPASTVQWYGPAIVQRTSFSIDGRPAYRLEPQSGQMWWYATSGASFDLDQYVGRTIHAAGPMSYRPDLRFFYLPVVQISLVR